MGRLMLAAGGRARVLFVKRLRLCSGLTLRAKWCSFSKRLWGRDYMRPLRLLFMQHMTDNPKNPPYNAAVMKQFLAAMRCSPSPLASVIQSSPRNR